MENQTHDTKPRESLFEKISFGLLLAASFLLPIFAIPAASFPFQPTKAALLAFFTIIACAFWIIESLKKGKTVIAKSTTLLAGAAVVAVYLISSLLSSNMSGSLIGQGFETGTFLSVAIFYLLMAVASMSFTTRERLYYFYGAFVASFAVVVLFHGLRLLAGPSLFSFGYFTDITANTVGRWNDLGIFLGLGAVVSLVTLELSSFSRTIKGVFAAVLALSIVGLAIVNFSLAWFVLGAFSLVFLVYLLSFNRFAVSEKTEGGSTAVSGMLRTIPIASMVLFLVSVLFIGSAVFGGNSLGNGVSSYFGVNQVEVRPSLATTFDIARHTLITNPLLGVGPNAFVYEWLKFKPQGINTTLFWNTDFTDGFGYIPTALVTVGLLGVLAWLVFLGFFMVAGVRSLLMPTEDRLSRYLVAVSFFASLYLWLWLILYVPGIVVIAFAFLFTGVFIATLVNEGLVKKASFAFASNPRVSFVSVLALVVLLLCLATMGYAMTEKYLASAHYQKALADLNSGVNPDLVQGTIGKAIRYSDYDAYYGLLTQLGLYHLNQVVNQKDVSRDIIRAEFQEGLTQAISAAKKAVSLNQNNYQNWLTLGRVYESVLPLRITGAYESANTAYLRALELNPTSPAILLALARLEVGHEDMTAAKTYIAQALEQKNDYTDAIFLLAQIQIAQGDTKSAIDSVETAALLDPNNPQLFFQLGLLKYNTKEYLGTVSSLERAVQLAPDFSNAKYFLGLSYYQLGRATDAVKQFEDILRLNPGNKEVLAILDNLHANKPPLLNMLPPNDRPETASQPPIPETPAATSPVPANTSTITTPVNTTPTAPKQQPVAPKTTTTPATTGTTTTPQ